jgi:hypothetical protein
MQINMVYQYFSEALQMLPMLFFTDTVPWDPQSKDA